MSKKAVTEVEASTNFNSLRLTLGKETSGKRLGNRYFSSVERRIAQLYDIAARKAPTLHMPYSHWFSCRQLVVLCEPLKTPRHL